MSPIRLTALLLLPLVAAQTPIAAQDSVAYQDVQRIFDARCTGCHSGADAARGLQCIHHRQADGSWKFARHMWSSDLEGH